MKKLILLIGTILVATCTQSQNRLVGGPCEGCEAVFEFDSRESLTPVDTLPGFEHAETKLKVTGTIYRPDGTTPASNIILYIYHTNEEGVYPTRGNETDWARRHGYLRGWIKTDETGSYTFYTRKPGSYSSNAAHIHATILEPDGKYYYITAFRFKGDPNLENVIQYDDGRGSRGVVELQQKDGLLVAERDIILGQNIPDYE